VKNPPISSKAPLDFGSAATGFLFVALAIGVPFGIATSPSIFRDGDVSWQVAAGEWILKHGRIPTADPFSFTAAGQPWVATEWLAEIVYASTFRLAGYAGLATIVAAAVIALNAMLFFYLQRRTSPMLLAATLVMMDFVLAPFALARPHVLAWLPLAGWTIALLRAQESGNPPSLWTALILVVWTNLHASYPLAIPIACAIGLDSLTKNGWANLREWMMFGLVSIVALALNANGVPGLLQPFKISSLALLPYIGEWHPSSPRSTPYFFAVLLAGLGALLNSGIRIPVGRLLLLLVMLALAFVHVRHQSSFIIVAACILPTLWPSRPADAQVPSWLLLAALPLLTFRAVVPLTPPESEANPRSLLSAIPSDLRTQPVFNGYPFGGPLILAGIRPYIDGRADLYGDAFVADYFGILGGDLPAFERAVQRYGIRWVMLPAGEKRLSQAIESSGEWRRVYADKIGLIDVKVPGPSRPRSNDAPDPSPPPASAAK